MVLVIGPSGVGKTHWTVEEAKRLQATHVEVSCAGLFGTSLAETESRAVAVFQRAVRQAPSVLVLDGIEALLGPGVLEARLSRVLLQLLEESQGCSIYVVATTSLDEELPHHPLLDSTKIGHPRIRLGAADAVLRESLFEASSIEWNSEWEYCTRGYSAADMLRVARILHENPSFSPMQLSHVAPPSLMAALPGVRLNTHIDSSPSLEDIYGHDAIILRLQRRFLDALKSPKLSGLPIPRGVLLYGPSGCGKTMLLQATARASGLRAIHVQSSDLLGKHVGDAEQAVARLFSAARSVSPCLIILDGLEALAGRRDLAGAGAESAVDRALSALLVQMDGASHKLRGSIEDDGVRVLAATACPEAVDPAMLRPGRFDLRLHVDYPNREARLLLLEKSLKKIPCDAEVTAALPSWADRTDRWSGARIVEACRRAALHSLRVHFAADINDSKLTIESLAPGNDSASGKATNKPTNPVSYDICLSLADFEEDFATA